MILHAMAVAPRDGSIILALYSDHSGFCEIFYHTETDFWCETDGAAHCSGFEGAGSFAGWVEIPPQIQALLKATTRWEVHADHRAAQFAEKLKKKRSSSDGESWMAA